MELLDLIRERLFIPSLRAIDKRAAIEEIVDFMVADGVVPAAVRPPVVKAVHGREDFMSTGLEHGIALPHGVTDAIEEELAAIAISTKGVPFESLSVLDPQPAQIIILLLTPASKALTRVRTLAGIARAMYDPAIRAGLIAAKTVEDALRVLRSAKRKSSRDG